MADTADVPGLLDNLLSISRAFKQARVIQLAVKLRLFNLLETAPDGLTCTELAGRLGLHAAPGFRGAADFFDLLVAVRALDRTGAGESARYRNTPAAAAGLVEGRPAFMGGIHDLNYDRSYVQFEYLEEVLRGGQLPLEALQRCLPVADVFVDEGDTAAAFARGMTGTTLGNAQEFARQFDLARYHSFADIGGSLGTAAMYISRAHPHLRCATYDLPNLEAAARAYLREHESSVEVGSLDFFADPFPRADVIMLGMILHDWGSAKKQLLIRKAYDALPQGGAFVALDMLLDDERRTAVEALARSLTMLVEFGRENAGEYTFQEFRDWTAEAGFSSWQRFQLRGSTAAAVAYK